MRRIAAGMVLGLLGVGALAGCTAPGASTSSTPVATRSTSGAGTSASPSATPSAAPSLSLTDPTSLWVVVNKTHPLNPKDYVPPDLVDVPVPHTNAPQLRKEASDAVVTMFDAAKRDGLDLASNSAYRAYTYQVSIYDTDVNDMGKAAADKLTARPGYSEHQTGLAIDIGAASGNCSLAACFETTPEGRWLAAHAWQYGFLLRYPKGLTSITGYDFEPWHYRYIGTDLAKRMHDSGVKTLEQEFGLGPAPDYPN
ncbi:M15 family metallopeptidase [Amnibacterium sp. CER49]|uniref:M15 family metallopeptidase n=1 Tax=Amnibacterium sp. CER49 TaxID=3039161 RepID=UPI002446AB8B|nr:M15 family metallopeptidase [Amnibacterium sp. CER49]MDH2443570.1 M15 family metallopeptidase [Amnibacterium sp. CER49]